MKLYDKMKRSIYSIDEKQTKRPMKELKMGIVEKNKGESEHGYPRY
jgi:hypothetical protein